MVRTHRLCIALFGLVALGCGRERTTPKAAGKTEAAQAKQPVPVAPVAHEPIPVFIDDRPSAELASDLFVAGTPLEQALPEGSAPRAQWTRLQSRAAGRRRQNISELDTRFPQHEVRLFVHPTTGQPALGLFAPDEDHSGVPKVHLDGLSEIRISTLAPPDLSTAKSLTVAVGGDDHPVTVEAFDALEAITAPEGSGGNSHTGHTLAAIVGQFTDVAKVDRVRLHSPLVETVLEIPGDAIRDPKQLLWVKRNREGLFRFKWFEHKDTNKAKGNVRALVRIEVVNDEAGTP